METSLTKVQADTMRQKYRTFAEVTMTRKRLMHVLITTSGLNHHRHSLSLAEAVVMLDDLFTD